MMLQKGRLIVGTSGWFYRSWRGLFYPADLPQSKWFHHYTHHLNSVEINASFYHFPTESAVQRWKRVAPKGFIYAVKAPRIITHVKKLLGVENLLEDLRKRLIILRDTLGVVLFQMPPTFRNTPENWSRIERLKDWRLPGAIEFRHSSWFDDKVYGKLVEMRLLPVTVYTHEESLFPIWPRAGPLYLRFHGTQDWYIGNYGEGFLRDLCGKVKREERHGFAYFNNDFAAAAVRDALCLKGICGL